MPSGPLLDKYYNDTIKAAPLAYYRMREGSGTTLVDSTTPPLNGTYNGSGVSWVSVGQTLISAAASGKTTPLWGSYYSTITDNTSNPLTISTPSLSFFDGVAGRATSTLTGINTSAASKVTVEFWFKWDGVLSGANGTFEALANFGGATGQLLGFLKNGASDYRFGISIRNTGDLWGLSNANTLAALTRDTWHHVMFVITNNAIQTTKLYIDGVQWTMTQQIGTTTTTESVSTAFALGYDGTASFFHGSMAEVAIYNGEPYANTTAVKNRFHQGAYGSEWTEVATMPGIEAQVEIKFDLLNEDLIINEETLK